jgi:hypothetical protein
MTINTTPTPVFVSAVQLVQELEWVVKRLVEVEARKRDCPVSEVAAEWLEKAPSGSVVAVVLGSIS